MRLQTLAQPLLRSLDAYPDVIIDFIRYGAHCYMDREELKAVFDKQASGGITGVEPADLFL